MRACPCALAWSCTRPSSSGSCTSSLTSQKPASHLAQPDTRAPGQTPLRSCAQHHARPDRSPLVRVQRQRAPAVVPQSNAPAQPPPHLQACVRIGLARLPLAARVRGRPHPRLRCRVRPRSDRGVPTRRARADRLLDRAPRPTAGEGLPTHLCQPPGPLLCHMRRPERSVPLQALLPHPYSTCKHQRLWDNHGLLPALRLKAHGWWRSAFAALIRAPHMAAAAAAAAQDLRRSERPTLVHRINPVVIGAACPYARGHECVGGVSRTLRGNERGRESVRLTPALFCRHPPWSACCFC